jgi:hypothetical protein
LRFKPSFPPFITCCTTRISVASVPEDTPVQPPGPLESPRYPTFLSSPLLQSTLFKRHQSSNEDEPNFIFNTIVCRPRRIFGEQVVYFRKGRRNTLAGRLARLSIFLPLTRLAVNNQPPDFCAATTPDRSITTTTSSIEPILVQDVTGLCDSFSLFTFYSRFRWLGQYSFPVGFIQNSVIVDTAQGRAIGSGYPFQSPRGTPPIFNNITSKQTLPRYRIHQQTCSSQ